MLNYLLMVLKNVKSNLLGRKSMDQEDCGKLDPKAQEDRRAFLRRAGKVDRVMTSMAFLRQ